MDYNEFWEELKSKILERYAGTEVVMREVPKINQKKVGYSIERGTKISPTIYPHEMFEMYKAYDEDMDMIFEIIDMAMAEKAYVYECFSKLKDFEQINSLIKPYVVNLEMNKQLLRENNYVHEEKLDLAIGVMVEFEPDEAEGTANVKITEGLLNHWGIDKTRLFEIAWDNVVEKVEPIQSMIKKLLGMTVDESDDNNSIACLLTNKNGRFGAVAMMNPKILKRATAKLGSLYCVPSSIHELLLVPADEGRGHVEDLFSMLKEINENVNSENEILSSSIYYYDHVTQELSIIEK